MHTAPAMPALSTTQAYDRKKLTRAFKLAVIT